MRVTRRGIQRRERLPQDILPEYKVNGFISALGRARWFLLATVLVSTLLLAHTYVEWNHCEAQRVVLSMLHQPLLTVKAAQKPVEALTESLANDLSQLRATQTPTDGEILRLVATANTLVERRKIINMLNDVKPQNQTLWFWMLPFNVPPGDYLPLMSLVLTVLSVCLWLSGRAVVITVRQCDDEALRDIARMHLLFALPRQRSRVETVGPPQGTKIQRLPVWTGADWWAKVPELLALAAPVLALTLAILQDWIMTRVLIRAGDFTARFHFGCLVTMCALILGFTIASIYLAVQLDLELYQDCPCPVRPRSDRAQNV
jgi:hypothetical protein